MFLTFGVIAHHCVGARWPTGELFMQNITLWWVCPWTLSPVQRANWLPAPKGDFSLYVRAYWPKSAVMDGLWTPPAVELAN